LLEGWICGYSMLVGTLGTLFIVGAICFLWQHQFILRAPKVILAITA